MTRAFLLLIVGTTLLLATTPLASACCHVREIEKHAGPCFVRWEGELFWLQTDTVTAGCAGHSASVENPVPGPREGGWPWDALP